MRILVLHNRYRSVSPSGENAVVDAEISHLRGLGHDVVGYLRDSDEIDRMGAGERALLPVRAFRGGEALSAIMDVVRRFRPDVAHIHNLNPLISPAVIAPIRAAGVPVVMTVHNFRLACLPGSFFRDGGECHDCLGRRFASPGVVHACYRGSRAQSLILATTVATHRRDYLSIDRFLALSPSVAGFLRTYGVPDSKIVIKPNTVEDPGDTGPPGSGFLYVGRLTAEKGPVDLLRAWAASPEGALGRLTIAGDGPLLDEVRRNADERSDVQVVGRVTPAVVSDLMRRCAVVVVPSRWAEAFPRVIAEALAHGRPVLTTDRGSLAEIVGDAGWAVPATEPGLADGLRRVSEADMATYGARARARFLEHYSEEVVFRTLVDVYRVVAGKQHGSPH